MYVVWQQEPCLGVHLLITEGNVHVLCFNCGLARQLHGCARRGGWRLLGAPHVTPATVTATPDTPHRQQLPLPEVRGALGLRGRGLHATLLQTQHRPAASHFVHGDLRR